MDYTLNVGGGDAAMAQMISRMARSGQLRVTDATGGLPGKDGNFSPEKREPSFVVRNAKSDTAEIDIMDEIGDPWFGVDAKALVGQIRAITAKKITVNLNSPGGDYFDGLAIFNALERHPAHVTMQVDGLAASAASIVAMAGDDIVMNQGAQLMIHDAISFAGGNAAALRQRADVLDKCSEDIAGIYAKKTGRPQSEWRAAMQKETWYNAEEAVTVGLATRTSETPVPEKMENVAHDWIEARKEWGAFRYAGRVDAPAPHMLSDEEIQNATPEVPVMTAEVTATEAPREDTELFRSLIREALQ